MTTAFVDRTSNVFGALGPDPRKRLERVVAKPTQRNWDAAYTIIVDFRNLTTLWQAWIAVDPDAPKSKPLDGKWPRIPDQLTIYRAIKHATAESTRAQQANIITPPAQTHLRAATPAPALTLCSQTPSELAALDKSKADATRAAESQARAAERKVQADREVYHFTLTPNDNPQRSLL